LDLKSETDTDIRQALVRSIVPLNRLLFAVHSRMSLNR
jgi:hypothetical protein